MYKHYHGNACSFQNCMMTKRDFFMYLIHGGWFYLWRWSAFSFFFTPHSGSLAQRAHRTAQRRARATAYGRSTFIIRALILQMAFLGTCFFNENDNLGLASQQRARSFFLLRLPNFGPYESIDLN